MLESVLKGEYLCNFVADLGNGVEEDLCEGGSALEVTHLNCNEFVDLYI